MKLPFLAALTLLAVGFSGCTSDIPPGFDLADYDGPYALLDHRDVPIDGMAEEYVECGDLTHLFVEYHPGDDALGDFEVRVYSESTRESVDEEGNPEQTWIQVFPFDGEQGRFSGATDGTYEREFIPGSEGTWKLEVHRTLEHDGRFVVQLVCA